MLKIGILNVQRCKNDEFGIFIRRNQRVNTQRCKNENIVTYRPLPRFIMSITVRLSLDPLIQKRQVTQVNDQKRYAWWMSVDVVPKRSHVTLQRQLQWRMDSIVICQVWKRFPKEVVELMFELVGEHQELNRRYKLQRSKDLALWKAYKKEMDRIQSTCDFSQPWVVLHYQHNETKYLALGTKLGM